MTEMIVLVMHGAPPKDFPPLETREYFTLHGILGEEHAHGHGHSPHAEDAEHIENEQRFAKLDERMRNWPRNAGNDPFFAGSETLANELARTTGLEIILAFNEFCAPSMEGALDLAVSKGAERIFAITPMMTSGGGHSEEDIPSALAVARERHSSVEFIYSWPYPPEKVAQFLAAQIARFQ